MLRIVRLYSKKAKPGKKLDARKLIPSVTPSTSVASTTTKSNKSSIDCQSKSGSPNYIPFSKFPKLPEHLQNIETNDLLLQVYDKPINDNLIEFEIPQEYSKTWLKAQLTPKDKALIEQLDSFMKSNDENEKLQYQLNMTKLYYDKDSFNYKSIPEHPLKKSLSGMINLNPHLNDIDDEYLWDLIPPDKLFGKPFFEKQDNIEKNFKDWEISMKSKNEENIKEFKINNDEINKFIENFNSNNKSFYTKVNGRYKLNRKLYKDYKNLKQKGKLIILKGDKSVDFDIEFENQNNDFKLKK